MSPRARHAVVIGASLSGMCVARALAEHVERVTIVERDQLPDQPVVRKGVPQAHHLHVLITAGQRALEELYPGLLAELHDLGAVPVPVPHDMLYLTATGWRQRFPAATHQLVGASRELIDWAVRRRLAADPRIEFRTGHDVVGLLPAPSGDAIAGVRLRSRAEGAAVQDLVADAVVDASGRSSRTRDWLAELGYPRPEEERIDAGLGYASRRYVLRDEVGKDWKTITILPAPPQTLTGAVLFPIENGRWMVTLGGIGDSRPPTDEDGFLEFTRTLRSPLIYEAIKDGQPDSPIHGFRQTSNHRWRYEVMPRFPDGLLVVGDAACSFNPVYGQGMSVAARTGVELGGYLRTRRGPVLLDRAAQALAADCAAVAWMIATGADRSYTEVPGEATLGQRWSRWYLARVSDVANHDAYVCEVFTDVLHLVRPPSALMRPGVLARALLGQRGPALAAPPLATTGPGTPP